MIKEQLLNIFNTPESPKAPEVRSLNIIHYCLNCFKDLEGGQKEIGRCVFCDNLLTD